MKKSTSTFVIALFTFFAVTVFATPQDNEKGAKVYKGEVVLAGGEVLKGSIEMLSPTLNEVKVKFIADNGEKTIYKSKDVQSYTFVVPVYNATTKSYDDQVIEYVKRNVEKSPIPFGPTEVLLERQVKGSISLFNHYYETRESGAYEHTFYAEKDGQLVEVNRENFRVVMGDLVGDYPELKAKLGKKGYAYGSVAEIIKEYNTNAATKNGMLGMN